MSPDLHIQRATTSNSVPGDGQFRDWVTAIAAATGFDAGLSIRIVDESEARLFNRKYRGGDYATNILSFPSGLPDGLPDEVARTELGDLLICAPVVSREALEQGKQEADHWAHLVIHGILHLLGYEHEKPQEAEKMELLEVKTLAGLGIADPYV